MRNRNLDSNLRKETKVGKRRSLDFSKHKLQSLAPGSVYFQHFDLPSKTCLKYNAMLRLIGVVYFCSHAKYVELRGYSAWHWVLAWHFFHSWNPQHKLMKSLRRFVNFYPCHVFCPRYLIFSILLAPGCFLLSLCLPYLFYFLRKFDICSPCL